MSSGIASTTVRRSRSAVRYARAASAAAVAGECSRSATAPTDAASAATSMRKLDRTAALATSAASTSSGVRLLAASVMPVVALVSPGPWCTDRIPGRPVPRAQASAAHAAPHSCLAATNRAPLAIRALVTWKLPLPTSPNTVSAPSPARVAPTASLTCISQVSFRLGQPAPVPGTGCQTHR